VIDWVVKRQSITIRRAALCARETLTLYDADLHARNLLKHGSWVLQLVNQPVVAKNLKPFSGRNPRRATLKSKVPVWLVLVNGGAAKRTTGAKRFCQFRTTLTSTSQTYNRTKASAPELVPCGCTSHISSFAELRLDSASIVVC
jgi:hypothetical protein